MFHVSILKFPSSTNKFFGSPKYISSLSDTKKKKRKKEIKNMTKEKAQSSLVTAKCMYYFCLI